MMTPTVLDIMTAPPVQVASDQSIEHVARLMREENVAAVLVTDGSDDLVGVVTARDLVWRALADGTGSMADVATACTKDPICLRSHDSVDEAAGVMWKHALWQAPVVEDGRAVGIVFLTDLLEERKSEDVDQGLDQAPVL